MSPRALALAAADLAALRVAMERTEREILDLQRTLDAALEVARR